jgi:hypothetical protein
MFCPQCKCEFVGWQRCPDCEVILLESLPEEAEASTAQIPYEDLLKHVRENGGQIEIELITNGVRREKKLRFPYQGHGYAWVLGMQGVQDGISVTLTTNQVGRKHGWRFPYFGYGYAWEKAMQGDLNGNPLDLKATKVQRERKWRFPYLGYGRAWAERLEGTCGDGLHAELEINEVVKKRTWRFPYQGYGFAWPKKGVLRLSLSK